ncbi:hypothetical protein [Nocardia noduli]|uniref:hypothetical protein n=1 Tax=Nocardia noduli TaxID=2815722 RepID=UPI001C21B10F|nr:hypothetical protein [Nocardia noduli]
MVDYTLAITPSEAFDGAPSSQLPCLTIDVNASSAHPTVTRIAITASGPAGIRGDDVRSFDMEAIVAALSAHFLRKTPRGDHADPAFFSPPTHDTTTLEEQRIPTPVPETELASEQASRSYRKMPDADELSELYEQLGTVTAVAKHYGVPRHSAQGWMGRLRKLQQQSETTPAGD